jgi:hypothetical protein
MQRTTKYVVLFTFAIVSSFFCAQKTFALDPLTTYTQNSISVSIAPEFPESGKEVTVTLTSYSTDLNRAQFSWSVDGTIVKTGIGEKEITLVAPASGQTKTVFVTATLVSGTVVEKSIPITPQDVDLLVESLDGYTPPFYKGRSLPVREGLIKVSAVPHLSNVSDTKDAVYNWTQNTKPLTDFSGYGKRYLVYKNAFLNSTDTISVVASSRTGSSTGKKQKTINLYQPKVLLYEDHPSQGLLLNKALTNAYALEESEATFVAFPYFSTPRIYGNPLADNLVYTWQINGTDTTPTEKNRITLRKPEGTSGTATLQVGVENTASNFQPDTETKTSISF